jgi:tyrosyl-tRNA synthetase
MKFASVNEQMDAIRINVVDIINEDELVRKIETSISNKTPLRVKLGLDPTRPDIHIGHSIALRKLRQMQNFGHIAVLIIGDFTAMIGDPTGKQKTRIPLTINQTKENSKSYIEQASVIIDTHAEKLEIRYNSDWLGVLSFYDIISLTSKYTVAQILDRSDFTKRFSNGDAIGVHEFLYPLSQAYDSIAVKADVELGGTDQTFNLLFGRELMRDSGMTPQCIITVPILEGLNGVEKMSKTLENYIGVTDNPDTMFGRVMSIPDTMTYKYLKYASNFMTNPNDADTEVLSKILNSDIHPKDAKVYTAKRIVETYYDKKTAEFASNNFENIFVNKKLPENLELVSIDSSMIGIVDIICMLNAASSKSEARRLIQGSAVSVDGNKIENISEIIDISFERIIRVGKLKFFRLISTKELR